MTSATHPFDGCPSNSSLASAEEDSSGKLVCFSLLQRQRPPLIMKCSRNLWLPSLLGIGKGNSFPSTGYKISESQKMLL